MAKVDYNKFSAENNYDILLQSKSLTPYRVPTVSVFRLYLCFGMRNGVENKGVVWRMRVVCVCNIGANKETKLFILFCARDNMQNVCIRV